MSHSVRKYVCLAFKFKRGKPAFNHGLTFTGRHVVTMLKIFYSTCIKSKKRHPGWTGIAFNVEFSFGVRRTFNRPTEDS